MELKENQICTRSNYECHVECRIFDFDCISSCHGIFNNDIQSQREVRFANLKRGLKIIRNLDNLFQNQQLAIPKNIRAKCLCGIIIKPQYKHCYKCNQLRKQTNWLKQKYNF